MDSIISAALEEICAQGANGVLLNHLWPKLQNSVSGVGLHLCNGVKQALWKNLLNVPGLNFDIHNSSSFSPGDPSIQFFEDSEKLGLKIIAKEHLRDSFIGLYDLKAADAGISPLQRRALERLAIARTSGITQSQLAKEFGIKGNNIFYIVRNLECRRLIVRQSTIVRTKEPGLEGENGMRSTPIVNTNLIHLYRYAKHLNLNSQQRLEIMKPDTLESLCNVDGSTLTGTGVAGEVSKDDVLIRDYLPAMKAVCDKLEEADGQVLVVSDIKVALGYRKTQGHRAWRNICNRLKEARLVEEFRAEVNKKVVSCLRLLKKFDPKSFQPKTVNCGYDDFDTDQPVKCGRRSHVSNQLVELPLEHQIYDMIDAEGSKGLTVSEVCKQLGLSSKRNYARLLSMFSRFGLHLQAESHNRSVLYRVWTSKNFNPGAFSVFPSNDLPDESELTKRRARDIVLNERSSPAVPQLDSVSKDEFTTPNQWNVENTLMELELVNESPSQGQDNGTLICGIVADDLLECGREVASEVTPKLRSGQRYPCLTLTAASAQREQRILERLQDEKFVLTVELYRWLEGLEKNKQTTMARKTLTRALKKLQEEGLCKCVPVSVPVVTNCGRSRTTEVVLHPSVESLQPELLGQIHERLRIFDMQSRGQGLARSKNNEPVPVLTGVKRTLKYEVSDTQAARAEAMRANGFVSAKMVRAKLLHNFLWGYLSSLPDWCDALSLGKHGYDLKNPHSTCKLFELDVAIKAMPLELFLQVIGSARRFEDLVESCRLGLCLSDLPVEDFKSLMDTHATGRLSWIVDILRRLKLIRLVTQGQDGKDMVPGAVLIHAMELRPYIEEPSPIPVLSASSSFFDLRPRIRHDFILSNKEAVDAYWKTLEYCYAAADSKAAVHAFPGSAVHEVYLYRSWASVRVMTADQRAELLKRVANDEPNKKISFKNCVKIAKDLNLTLEQVLRFSYDKRRSRVPKFQRNSKSTEQEHHPVTDIHHSAGQKRKRSAEDKSTTHADMDDLARESGRLFASIVYEGDIKNMEVQSCCQVSVEDHDPQVHSCDEENYVNYAEDDGPNEEDGDDSAFLSQYAFSRLKPRRQKKFLWTDRSDRQLVIQYAKYRAALGVKINRVDWTSLPDLPAPPETCRRRMSALKQYLNVRRALMNLCNLLADRYAKHLAKTETKEAMNCGDSEHIVQDLSIITSSVFENILESNFQAHCWDDPGDPSIRIAVDEVLRCNQMAKLDTSKRVGSRVEKEWPDIPGTDGVNWDAQASDLGVELELLPTDNPGEGTQDISGQQQIDSRPMFEAGQSRLSSQRLPGKYLRLLDNSGVNISKLACESLAVSNAVELIKIVLYRPADTEVPKLLAETLQRYSEHDIFAAINYLRMQKFVVVGHGIRPFVLSPKFHHNASSSPFPVGTGSRSDNFARWLSEMEGNLEDGVTLNSDLHCGDIFHLFALVSSGEFLISPILPSNGIGEVDSEGQRNLKRKADKEKVHGGENFKKPKLKLMKDGELCYRREKGFPGIQVSLRRSTISRVGVMEMFMNNEKHTRFFGSNQNDQCDPSGLATIGTPSHVNPYQNFNSTIPLSMTSGELPWEAMTKFSERTTSEVSVWKQASPFHAELFETVHLAIQKAGDQGLSIEEVSQVINEPKMDEAIVDALQVFGLVVKVNAFDHVRTVDASYAAKYSLSLDSSHTQDPNPVSQINSMARNNDLSQTLLENYEKASYSEKETDMNFDGHKISILPKEASPDEARLDKGASRVEGNMQGEASLEGAENETSKHRSSPGAFWPIFPWMDGDGGTNSVVYKALTRRVLGTVMQSPGILEDEIIRRLDVLNPQSCRKLLELLIADDHLIVREMHQTTSNCPPTILGGLLGSKLKTPESVFRRHYFTNPMSTGHL